MYKILFVGSNPSQRSKSTLPFWHDTKSMIVLDKWIDAIGCESISSLLFCNVSDLPTTNNRPLKISEIKSNLTVLQTKIEQMQPHKIIALGKTAEKALTLLHQSFYSMPHPSPVNRKLNDAKYVEEKINGMKVNLHPI